MYNKAHENFSPLAADLDLVLEWWLYSSFEIWISSVVTKRYWQATSREVKDGTVVKWTFVIFNFSCKIAEKKHYKTTFFFFFAFELITKKKKSTKKNSKKSNLPRALPLQTNTSPNTNFQTLNSIPLKVVPLKPQ